MSYSYDSLSDESRALFPADFVMHSLRHTMLSRLGECVDAFTIMRIARHSIVVSRRYIHPTPEAVELGFERLKRSGAFAVIEPKRHLSGTESATVEPVKRVSH